MATQVLKEGSGDRSRRPPKRAAPRPADAALVRRLLRRDEEACGELIRAHHQSMVRIARNYVRTRAVAEEVAQEAWMAFFRGLKSFEGRSSLKTWLFSILIQRARAMGAREHRTEAVSQLAPSEGGSEQVDDFFHDDDHPRAGSWAVPPLRWKHSPEAEALDSEMRGWISEALAELPEAQQLVFTLRHIEGWESSEIAKLVDHTRNWVRVNLFRARFRLRQEIEAKMGIKE